MKNFSILLTIEDELGNSLSFASVILKNKENIFEGQADEAGVLLMENIVEGAYKLILKKDKKIIFKEFVTINENLIYDIQI